MLNMNIPSSSFAPLRVLDNGVTKVSVVQAEQGIQKFLAETHKGFSLVSEERDFVQYDVLLPEVELEENAEIQFLLVTFFEGSLSIYYGNGVKKYVEEFLDYNNSQPESLAEVFGETFDNFKLEATVNIKI